MHFYINCAVSLEAVYTHVYSIKKRNNKHNNIKQKDIQIQ